MPLTALQPPSLAVDLTAMGTPTEIESPARPIVSIPPASDGKLRENRPILNAKSWTLAAALLLFLLTRWYILTQQTIFGSTLDEINVTYAIEANESHRTGVPLSAVHRRRRLESSARRGRDISDSMDAGVIGYPPLAVAWMRLPYLFGSQILEDPKPDPQSIADAVQMSRVSSAVLDLGAFLLVMGFLFYGYTGETRQIGMRLSIFVAGGVLMSHLLYDRLDLALGAIFLTAVVLFSATRHFAFAFFILALGINFKLVPVVLAPLWILAALPPSALAPQARWRKLIPLMLTRALVLAGFAVLCLVPFLFSSEWGSLDYLSLHAARGVQMESIWSSLALLGGHLGYPVDLYSDSGSVNIRSAWTPFMMSLSTLSVAASILLITGCFWLYAKRRVDPHSGCGTIAQALDSDIVTWSVLTLVAVMGLAKVFSASYPLWLVTLLPLVLPKGKKLGSLTGLFLVICLLTTLLYPYIYPGELAPEIGGGGLFRKFGPTTGFGETVLDLRNLLFLGFGGLIAWELRKQFREPVR